jgi:DNA topoisomerase VI subunit B
MTFDIHGLVDSQVHQKGRHSVGAYLKQTAIANPHVTFHFCDPHGEEWHLERITSELPQRPVEIKPHPRGVELGQLIQMLSNTDSQTLVQFLENEFSRVGRKTAREIIRLADRKMTERSSPKRIAHRQSTALYRAMQAVPVSAPPADCLVPIGEELLEDGLRKEVDARFYTVVTRPPAVYRGNPFVIEIGMAYGHVDAAHLEKGKAGKLDQALAGDNGTLEAAENESGARADEPAQLLRFANRVPLLYEQEACAINKAIVQTNWRAYGLKQGKGALPIGPLTVFVHMASVWVPFASEAKEAIASYPEIIKEIKLGLQQCGRRLAAYLRSEARDLDESDKRARVEKYLPHIGLALQQILKMSDDERQQTIEQLHDVFQKRRSRK